MKGQGRWSLGEGVKGLKKGDRVAYVSTLGSYAEERNVAAAALVPIPEGISYATAAAMMLKGLTAQYLLRRTYRVKPGDIILNHAAAGGVGLILGQWANALGATVIGTVGSDEKAKLAKRKAAAIMSSITAPKILPNAWPQSPKVKNAMSFMMVSVKIHSRCRLIAYVHSECL